MASPMFGCAATEVHHAWRALLLFLSGFQQLQQVKGICVHQDKAPLHAQQAAGLAASVAAST